MKILQVCPKYYPDIGGLEEHVQNISERLAKNHEVTIATTDPSGILTKEEVINSVKILRFKSWAPNQSYFFSKDLKKYLKKSSQNFDISHAHSYSAFPALYAAQTKYRNKFVFTSHYHGTGHTFFRAMLHRPYKLLGKKIFKNADKIICVSEYEKNLLLHNFKIDEKKITIIPNGVDPEEFGGFKKQCIGCSVILYVGRLEKYKGVHYLIKALPKLGKGVILEIVGQGPYKEALIKQAKRCNVVNQVKFRQNLLRKELLQEYANADLFVSLSEHEAYGITVAESLMSGVPCLLANSSSLTEWIDNVHCFGINFPINIDDLAFRIKTHIGKKIDIPDLPNWRDVAECTENTYCSLF